MKMLNMRLSSTSLIVLFKLLDFLFKVNYLFFPLFQLFLQFSSDFLIVIVVIIQNDFLDVAFVGVDLLQFENFDL